MGETSLKFGPEWLRALSHGGGSSPPSSPLPVKFKLAGFRYGREEMLALFSKDLPPPDNCDSLGALFVEEMQLPLNFLPLNAEEQRMFARGVNTDAVLRGTGRPPTNGVGRGRGGSVDRGRGRARGGLGAPYYSRGVSYDEDSEARSYNRDAGPPGLNGRGRIYDRSQSANEPRGWNERGVPERGTNPSIEEKSISMVSPRKEPNRANNENWRLRAVEEAGDRWSGLSSNRNEKWGPRTTWREREGIPENEWEEIKSRPNPGGYTRGIRPWHNEHDKDMLRRQWEQDNLPEWATESTDDKGGSFDAAGAFHAPGYSDDEDPVNTETINPSSIPDIKQENETQGISEQKLTKENNVDDFNKQVNSEDHQVMKDYSLLANGNLSERERIEFIQHQKPDGFGPLNQVGKIKEEEVEDLEHMQIVADDLVARLVEDDDPKLVNADVKLHHSNIPPPAGYNCHNNQLPPEEQWYYTDPQGEIQGPFSSEDMTAWYEVGYFKSNLLLRRQCDDKFAQLGDLMRVFGRMPFLPGPIVPPLKVSELMAQKVLAQKAMANRERLEILQLKNQIYQQQTSVRQNQVYQQLQRLDEWNKLSSNQQQQLFMQQMMTLPSIPPAIPAALHDYIPPATTASMMTVPSGFMAKNSNSGVGVSPIPEQSQDPIQVLMAQMQNQAAAAPISSGSSLEVPVQMAPSSSCPVPEGPLQKLLTQLQRSPASSQPVPPAIAHPTNKAVPTQPVAEPVDPIKAFLSRLSKRQPSSMDSAQEEHKRREDEKRVEAERVYEEQRLKEAELRFLKKYKEERRLQELEEEKLLLEQEMQIQTELEEKLKLEELKKREMEQKKAEEAKLLEEENRKAQKLKRKEEEEAKKKEEAERREAKRKEEERERLTEEKRKKQEEEKKRQERQAHNQELMRKNALEEERKRMNKVETAAKRASEDQKRPKNQKQTHAWTSKAKEEAISTPSLIEIQKAQEIRDKREKEAESKDQKRLKEATKKANEEKRQKELKQSWAGAMQQDKKVQISQPPMKSLLEIQQEEEKALKKRLKKEQSDRATTVNHMNLNAAGVWGSAAQSLSWANRASSGSGNSQPIILSQSQPNAGGSWTAIAQGNNSVLSNVNGENNSGGFWDNPGVKMSKSHSTVNVSNTAMPSKNLSQSTLKPNLAVNNKLIKKKNKEDSLKKLFSDNVQSDGNFACWCNNALVSMKVNAPIDIPTFVGFLAEVDSPYEVHDYIRSYLGDSKEVRTFARDYLEKRSKAKNALKQKKVDDDILAPAPAVNPGNNLEFQEIKTKVKKTKKKMQKFDNNLLGFMLPANEQPTEKK